MSAELVGRDEEMKRVGSFVAELPRGGRAMVIEGEAGAGKTAIWEAALVAAREAGVTTLGARPAEAETTWSYAALRDLLEARPAALEGLPAPQARALAAALLLADAAEATPDQQVVALAALGALRALAVKGPLLVAVDDVQWIDASSAAVLSFVARRLDASPIGLLLALRTAGGEPAPLGLERALPLERLTRLELPGLSLGAVSRLLADQLDYVPARPVLHRLHELAAGNPFFALELGRALRAGTLRLEPGERLPVSLDALVAARLGGLSPGARRALAAAAALAVPTVELVSAVAGEPRATLAEAERARIVDLREERVRFAHPLLASGAYAAVDPPRRRELHAAAAARVSDSEERARHLALAARGPDETVARALEDAARRAQSRGAPPAAAELYERAARLTPPERATDIARRTMDAAFSIFQCGDSRRARELLDSVVAGTEPGPLRARALIRLSLVRGYDDDLRAAEALLHAAAEQAGGDAEIAAAAHNQLAGMLFRLRERLDEAAEHAKQAVAAARRSGAVTMEAEALGGQLLPEAALGRPGASAVLEAALELQPRCTGGRVIAQPLFQVACTWLWWDELERARDGFEQLSRRAREMGDEGSLPYVLVLLAQVECVRGDLPAAARHADEGYALAEQAGQTTLEAYLLAVRALRDALAGDVADARRRAERSLALAASTNGRPAEHFARTALGLLELSLGRPGEAHGVLAPLVEFLRRERITEPGTARVLPDQIEALIALDRLDAAAELLGWYESNARRLGRRSALAAAARCRGLLAGARGHLEAALAELEQALALAEGLPLPLERGRTQLAYGGAQRRAKHKRAARDALEASRATFEAMGAGRWAARAVEELARVGGRKPASGVLTPTERRVAGLVAEGLQTKQVAATLFVSPKTVEGHLTHIYDKLGIHSRTELAHRWSEL